MKLDTGVRLRKLTFEETGFQQRAMACGSVPVGVRQGPLPRSHGRELTVGAPGGVGGCRLSASAAKDEARRPSHLRSMEK
jgi:hypothetical protein